MANEKLNDYIKKCIELGKQQEEITSNLLSVGWSKEDIDASFSIMKVEEIPTPEEPKEEGAPEEQFVDGFSSALNNEINSIQEENNNLNDQSKQEDPFLEPIEKEPVKQEDHSEPLKQEEQENVFIEPEPLQQKEVIEEEKIIDNSKKKNPKKIIIPIVAVIVTLLIFSIVFAFRPFSFLKVEPEIVQENENFVPQEEEVIDEPEVIVIWNCGEELIDDRDGRNYSTMQIGSQCWMTKNLNYITGNSSCYNDDVENCEAHGLLYDWNTAIIACPLGWSLPSDNDFKMLERYLGMEEEKINVTGWREVSPNAEGTLDLLNITLSGVRDISGQFKYKGEYANLWLSDSVDDLYSARAFRTKDSNIYKGNVSGEYGYSVRCIKY